MRARPPFAVLVAIAALALSCEAVEEDPVPPPPSRLSEFAADVSTDDLAGIRERKVLRALVSPSRTDFFVADGRPRGLQADLLENLEKVLNEGNPRSDLRVRVRYIPVTFDRLLPALVEGRGDIACALLTITPQREAEVAFATSGRLAVDEVVVTHRDVTVERVADLAGRSLYVLRGSSYAEHLRELNGRLEVAARDPIEIIEADPHLQTEDILELVNAGVVDITVCDDYIARLWGKVLPNIAIHESVAVHTGGAVGWAVRKDNPELLALLEELGSRVKIGTALGNILFKRYYDDVKWISNPLADAERRKLEVMTSLFRKYGDRYGFDWLAVAAQSYQESGLDNSVHSPRGAVGVMQVLPATAADPAIGIENVEDLESNIHAGVRYLAHLRDTYFADPDISDEDRQAFAWAAYNAGPSRVRNMREHAAANGWDPNRWFENVEYSALALVGQETVRYVANVYKYYIAYALDREIRTRREERIRSISDRASRP